MSGYDLPTTATIGGVERPIRSDYRAILDIIEVMCDAELDDEERAMLVLSVFYHDFDSMPVRDFQEALDYAYWFVGGGKRQGKGKPRLMDWGQDFPIVAAPVNRVLGFEVRSCDYLHWWTFLSAYYEIGGDCLFAQVISVRKKRMAGKRLDKSEQAFYRENRDLVDLDRKQTAAEAAVIDEWTKG